MNLEDKSMSKMQLTSETGTQFWNDSCSIKELSAAVKNGAVGATTNPVIVHNVITGEEEYWSELVNKILSENKNDLDSEVAWKVIKEIGKQAAELLYPAFQKYDGKRGRLSLQVNPEFYNNSELLIKHAEELASVAENTAIKIPCTAAGLIAIEEVTAKGICVNVTVSYTLSQAIQSAEAIERGLKRAKENGIDTEKYNPFVTLMVGRLDDHLKRVADKEKILIDPGMYEWAGVAVFKKAYKIFKERGYKSILLSAAYRNHMHWSELIGGDVIVSIPYKWWNKFNNSNIEVVNRINEPVNPDIVNTLYDALEDFRKAYDEEGLAPEEFLNYGATVATLNQFTSTYYELMNYLRNKRIENGNN